MTLVPSHPQPSNGNNLQVKKHRSFIVFFLVFVFFVLEAQQTPESFISHKDKKRETRQTIPEQKRNTYIHVNKA